MRHDLFIVERVVGLAVFCCRSLLWRVSLWFVPVIKFGFSSLWVSLGCGQSFRMWITLRNWTFGLLVSGEFRVCLGILRRPLCVVCFSAKMAFGDYCSSRQEKMTNVISQVSPHRLETVDFLCWALSVAMLAQIDRCTLCLGDLRHSIVPPLVAIAAR